MLWKRLSPSAALLALLLAVGVLAGPSPLLADAEAAGTATIVGRLVDEDGRGINRLEVSAVPLTGNAPVTSLITGADGAFRLLGLPAGGPILLGWNEVRGSGYFLFFGFYPGVSEPSKAMELTLVQGEERDLGTIQLRSTPVSSQTAHTSLTKAQASKAARAIRKAIRKEKTIRPRGCSVGQVRVAAQKRVLAVVNQVRGMTGLKPVGLSAGYSATAQQAALIQHYQGGLKHFPPKSAQCYSKKGAKGSSSSNLAWGSSNAKVVIQYMADAGSTNTAVGHRRWILNPLTRKIGVGQVGIHNVLHVVGSQSDRNPVPRYVSWPSAGYFPKELEPGGRWSFSTFRTDLSLEGAKVGVTAGGKAIALKQLKQKLGYGDQSAVVWDFAQRVASGKTYTVTITGMSLRGIELPPYSYDVQVFRVPGK